MKKTILLSILMLTGLFLKAQTGGYIEYKPVTLPPSTGDMSIPDFSAPRPREISQSRGERTPLDQATIVQAYTLNPSTNTTQRLKLKIVENKYGTFIIGYKNLSDELWTDIRSLPIKASRISTADKFSEYFEFSALIGSTVYF